MAFTEKLKLVIEATTDGFTSAMSKIKSSVGEADGVMGKLKAGTGGLKDAFSALGPAAQGGIAVGGIAAVGGAVMDAVGQFADLGQEVGKFSEATGTSTEDASRLIEVFGDMGVDSGTLEGSLNKLNKSIDPQKFKSLGIEIGHTKDGATDVNGTFMNVIDRLNGIAEPTEKARVGTELLGKGWTNMAEAIGKGSGELTKSMADVSDVKVLSADDVADARDFRDTMDDLQDAGQELFLTFGKALLPAVLDMAHSFADVATSVGPLVDKLAHLISVANELGLLNPLGGIPGSIAEVAVAVKAREDAVAGANKLDKDWADTIAEGNARIEAQKVAVTDTSAAIIGATAGVDANKASIDKQKNAVDEAKDSAKRFNEQLDRQADAARKAADALNAQVDAAFASADSFLSFNDAGDRVNKTRAETTKALDENGEGSEEYTNAVDAERDAIIGMAKASLRYEQDLAAASGTTMTAEESLTQFNKALTMAANDATPAAQRAAYDYVAQVNQIPLSRATEIKALVSQGSLDEANLALTNSSVTRMTTIIADADTSRADGKIAATVAGPYTANIEVGATGAGLGGAVGSATPGSINFGDVIIQNNGAALDPYKVVAAMRAAARLGLLGSNAGATLGLR